MKYIEPDIVGIRLFEFNKAEQIFKQAEPAMESLKEKLCEALQRHV